MDSHENIGVLKDKINNLFEEETEGTVTYGMGKETEDVSYTDEFVEKTKKE